MGSPTENYVDYAAGNDYSGSTFADGVYTDSTKNLAKTGAFTNSKVGHRIYLTGTGITSGYYTIATVTDANNVVLATDAGSDSTTVACTQHDGTTSLPWNTVQGALDLCGRDSTNGDRINVKSGTAVVNYTSLNLTTYGTPAEAAPLIIQGYTTTAGDRGMGEIDCNGIGLWSATSNTQITLCDLEIHNGGDNNLIQMGNSGNAIIHCEVHPGASNPSSKYGIYGGGSIVNCYIHDFDNNCTAVSSNSVVVYCYLYNCHVGISSVPAILNVLENCYTYGISLTDGLYAIGNTIYSGTASTGDGINIGANQRVLAILNNIITGYSGTGGHGLDIASGNNLVLLGYNAYYNNTVNENLGDVDVNLGGKQELTSDPFTNAASGDFSLSTAVTGAIDGAFPGAWYGPASTTDHADIGAVQNPAGTAGGGFPILNGSIVR